MEKHESYFYESKVTRSNLEVEFREAKEEEKVLYNLVSKKIHEIANVDTFRKPADLQREITVLCNFLTDKLKEIYSIENVSAK
ncbi:hypothetical protein [Bacillus sp. Marseille-P3661]|uniref:hypothetical protein n=1 Tax=Bacillus sp. Marseille-P3661 TaxID=1936234 RepID=UPI000C856728|nr:hypothetical protein [Bacillus sp. Marseille-P3661]